MTLSKNIYPYWDTFTDSNGDYQVLGKPGVSLQVREWNEMQSMLQNQIATFGDNIFKEGSMVIPGGSALNVNYPFIKLQNQFNAMNIVTANFVGKQIIGSSSGAIATVLQGVDLVGSDSPTLYLQFNAGSATQTFTGQITLNSTTVSGLSSAALKAIVVGSSVTGTGISASTYVTKIVNSSTVQMNNPATATNSSASLNFSTTSAFEDGENISTIETSPFSATLITPSASGIASCATISQGVYFVAGYFVWVNTQTILLDKYDNTPSYNIGLSIQDSFVTAASDPSLVDNANGSLNANAPGADRYHIDLVLTKFALNATPSSNFVQLIQVQNGVIQSQVSTPTYSLIEKALAKEFYDANGNYYKKAFPLVMREHLNTLSNNGVYTAAQGGNAADMVYAIGRGKAYVQGYQVKTLATTFLTAPKAQTTTTYNGIQYPFDPGNYVIVNTMNGTFNTTSYEKVNLNNATVVSGSGTTIGTAYIREMILISGSPGSSGTTYQLNLYDVNMSSGTFADVLSIRDAAGNTCNTVLTSSDATLNETNLNSVILPINEFAVSTIMPGGSSATDYAVRRYFTGTLSGTAITLTANAGETFAGSSTINYHVALADSTVIDMSAGGNSIVLGGSPTGNSVTLTLGSNSGATISVLATVNKTDVVPKTKTAVLNASLGPVGHASNISLGKADVYQIVSVTDNTTSANITNQYTLSTGQTDNYYGLSSVNFNSAYAAPAGNVTIVFNYFTHGVGDYFSADSYTSAGVAYSGIPVYVSPATGTSYILANCLDFRPRINDSGTGYSVYSEFPVPESYVTFNYSAYLGRIDLIFLDKNGNFSVIQGAPAVNPNPPNAPAHGMVLFQAYVPPYTNNATMVTPTTVENRGYTMADIGDIDRRVSNLEYYVSMTLLEQQTSSLFIDDGSGNNAFKNGFIVDNFTSHLVGAVNNPDYQCSMDTTNGVLRPSFALNNVGLTFSSSNSSNYQLSAGGELITLPYTTQSLISQLSASDTININPYNFYTWVGNITLSPSSDDWYDTQTAPAQVITTAPGAANAIAALNAAGYDGETIWDSWVNSWVGSPITEPTQDLTHSNLSSYLNSITSQNATTTSTYNYYGSAGTYTGSAAAWTLEVEAIRQGSVNYSLPVTPPGSMTVGSQVVSTSAIPFMRANTITFTATGMSPNTTVYAFFDNVNVSAYCTPTNGSLAGPLITDINGHISGTFALPDTTALQFPTGAGVFTLIDNNTNNSAIAVTSASATYTATGILDTDQTTILSTAASGTVQVAANGSNSLVGSNLQQQVTQRTIWLDPLAQQFLINPTNGVFLTQIDIYFATADNANIPVTLQIRDISNGYPGPDIVPFSTVTLNPSQVNVSTNGSAITSFVFSNPVYLNGGQDYCFVLLSNSNGYTVYEATLGDVDLISGARISQSPYAGSMFESQNGETWIASPYSKLKFNIWQAQFNTTETATIEFLNDVIEPISLGTDPFTTTSSSATVTAYHPNHGLLNGQSTTIAGVTATQNGITAADLNGTWTTTLVDFDHYTFTAGGTASASGACGGTTVTAGRNIRMDTANFNIQNLNFAATTLNFQIKTLNSSGTQATSFAPIPTTQDIDFVTSQLAEGLDNETTKSITFQALMTTTDPNISPVIDTQRASVIIASNRIDDINTGENSTSGGDALARYITGNVTLTNESNNITVYFDAIRPPGADIDVYVKMLNSTNPAATLATVDWTALNQISYPAADASNYDEYQFSLLSQANFNVFAVKIVMLSTDTAEVPQIISFRGIAT